MAAASNLTLLFNELKRAEAFLERIPSDDQRSRSWAGARERRALKRQPAGGGGTLFWTDPFGRSGACAVVAPEWRMSRIPLKRAALQNL